MDELHLSVSSATELINILSSVNVRLTSIEGGRAKKLAEKYLMSHVLATVAESTYLRYPISVKHGDKPDFLIALNNEVIGVECVKSTPKEWQEIQALRQREGAPLAITIPRFGKSSENLTLQDKRKIAAGNWPSYPIMGNSIEVDWAHGLSSRVADKTKKLRDGAYGSYSANWLLVHDLWPGASHFESDLREAAEIALPLLPYGATNMTFDVIFVKSHLWLVTFTPGHFHVEPIYRLPENG